MKRLISCVTSELQTLQGKQLVEAIARSEGRVMVSETIGSTMPLLGHISNAELAAAMGADLIILNLFDLDQPMVQGLPEDKEGRSVIEQVRHLTGRLIGINLEPTRPSLESDPSPFKMIPGRIASADNAKKALDQGADFLVITGNPETGVDNPAITMALKEIRQAVGQELLLIAGKMHGSGILSETSQNIITSQDVRDFVSAGADVILLPAPGTIPGITLESIRELVKTAHEAGTLTMTAIGTSQEGADEATIRQIALWCKMSGTDMHHIGDAGYLGLALPENILAYSIAIRGIRHTYSRMAASIRR